MANHRTLPELARLLDVTARQAEFAVQRYAVEATTRIGIVRLFDDDAAERVVAALKRTGALDVNHPGLKGKTTALIGGKT